VRGRTPGAAWSVVLIKFPASVGLPGVTDNRRGGIASAVIDITADVSRPTAHVRMWTGTPQDRSTEPPDRPFVRSNRVGTTHAADHGRDR